MSETCLQASEIGDEGPKQMLRLGSRHARGFLGEAPQEPYFGLSEKGKFISCAQTEDNKVQILREAALKLPALPSQLFIRVRHELPAGATPVYEYATEKPIARPYLKRHSDGSYQPVFSHHRWIYGGGKFKEKTHDNRYFRKLVTVFPELVGQPDVSIHNVPAIYRDEPRDAISRCLSVIQRDIPLEYPALLPLVQASFEERSKRYQEQGEEIMRREECEIEHFRAEKMGIFWPGYTSEDQSIGPWYEMVYGDESAALFADTGAKGIRRAAEDHSLIHFHEFFQTALLDPKALCQALCKRFASVSLNDPYWRSLRAISYAASLYTDIKIATIDVRVLEHSLCTSPWITQAVTEERRSESEIRRTEISAGDPSKLAAVRTNRFAPKCELGNADRRSEPKTHPMKSQKPSQEASADLEVLMSYRLDLEHAFSCICFFESGRFQVKPDSLRNVMAMCSNDLMWVATYLLNDPSSGYPPNEKSLIRAFPGNIGRSGIAFMVPPIDPMIRPSSILDFRNIVHRPFEGHLQNKFRSTSLHLSFTTAESSINVGFSGMKDDEVYLLETLLSVHEGGEWIADLDVQKSFSSIPNYAIVKRCKEHMESQIGDKLEASCIDNWAELLDPPETRLSVVRACGDWQARLAAFTIAIATGNKVIVLPDTICWDSLNDMVSGQQLDKKLILIA